MDLKPPINVLKLVAASNADDLSYVALADISKLATDTNMGSGYRLIGGQMVTLHARRWLLGEEFFRETTDADMGVHTRVLTGNDPREHLERASYEKVSGSRFEKRLNQDSAQRPTIDILVPTYTSRAKESVEVGSLTTTQVRGLANALNRSAVEVELHMTRLNGQQLEAKILLPDETAAFVLKAYAFDTRRSGKDAVDLWRCLEILYRADVVINGEEKDEDIVTARRLVIEGFKTMTTAMTTEFGKYRKLSHEALTQDHTRVRALVNKTLSANL